MTPQDVLSIARIGDIAKLSANVEDVTSAVHSFVEAGDVTSALEIVGRSWRVWSSTGHLDEGADAAQAALGSPQAPDDVWRMRALYGDGVIAFRAGDNERSRARNEELLDLARSTGDVRGQCDGLTGLARLALREGDYESVVRLAREGRDHAHAGADSEAEAAPLHLEAAGLRLQQRYDEARSAYLRSLELNQRLGNHAAAAMEQHNLGWVDLHRGDVASAESWFRQRDLAGSADGYTTAWSDLNRSALAVARGDWDEAKRRFDAGKHAEDSIGVALDPDDAFEMRWLESQLAFHAPSLAD